MKNLSYKLEDIRESTQRFAAYDGSTLAGEVTFVRAGDEIWIIDHTFVDDDYRGQNLGEKLIKHIVSHAIEQNKKIIPLCPFARREFDRNPEYQKLEHK